jgi:plasmid stability protein
MISSSRSEVDVAQFVVRNLEDEIAEKLKTRARRHARSTEAEIRHILRAAVQEPPAGARKLGTRIARRFQRSGLREDLPELRGAAVRAAEFER